MSKAILVIDMPDDCSVCELCSQCELTCRDYCRITGEYIFTSEKPDWCPLRELPEKYDMSIPAQDKDYTGDYEYGYNACINEILDER